MLQGLVGIALAAKVMDVALQVLTGGKISSLPAAILFGPVCYPVFKVLIVTSAASTVAFGALALLAKAWKSMIVLKPEKISTE